MHHLSFKPRRRVPLLAGFVPWLVLAVGCGYALVGKGSNIPEDVREVYVQSFENQTQRTQAEQFLTEAIADEMVTRQRFALVSSAREADAVLSGTVVGFGVTPVTFDGQGRATEYEISITARVAFRRSGEEGEVLWSNDRYLFRENYPVQVGQEDYFDREDLALEEASRRFAETMVSDLLEGF